MIKQITTKEELKLLYKNSIMSYEGLTEEGIKDGINFLKKKDLLTEDYQVYVTKGKTMNEICGLTGRNAYPSDLNIVSYVGFKGGAYAVGGRWMDDIIDNNADREKYHPFAGELSKANFSYLEEDYLKNYIKI